MERSDIVKALNMWMQKYIDNPKEFEAEFQTVMEFLADSSAGKEPTYGEECLAYMEYLLAESKAVSAVA